MIVFNLFSILRNVRTKWKKPNYCPHLWNHKWNRSNIETKFFPPNAQIRHNRFEGAQVVVRRMYVCRSVIYPRILLYCTINSRHKNCWTTANHHFIQRLSQKTPCRSYHSHGSRKTFWLGYKEKAVSNNNNNSYTTQEQHLTIIQPDEYVPDPSLNSIPWLVL